ncbi:REP element-mobilizing transposase RayT [Ruminococcus flavefaciens]|uniref:REP element-mobilizing transposase RayT n=1 Tax=Ruminococcus flavefaciens TaxID=1265 RepID=A0A1H6ISR9_RUMFL|nr:transposase [Ruminococcus flavefaciens]SEH51905.1 REP element-mobilizing transposase RayT [Ruminococcus flavefaciens]
MDTPQRKDIRLNNYDYSRNGAYFVTICTRNRRYLFWNDHDIRNVGAAFGGPHGKITLTEYGRIVREELKKIPSIYPDIVFVPKFVIMPNHIHLIIVLNAFSENGPPKAAPTIGSIINKFKGAVSKKAGFKVWQKNFFDRVLRNEWEYRNAWQYIENNPENWENDELFCKE